MKETIASVRGWQTAGDGVVVGSLWCGAWKGVVGEVGRDGGTGGGRRVCNWTAAPQSTHKGELACLTLLHAAILPYV